MIADIVDKQLAEFQTRYRKASKPLTVSFRSLCSGWSWAMRSEAYTHLMHRYPAKMFPYIPIFFLSSEEFASEKETVLDVFAGTGTVLLESIVHPYLKRNALGVEINPLGRLISKVKTTPIDADELLDETTQLFQRIEEFNGDIQIPDFPNRDVWFAEKAQHELAKIIACIQKVEKVDIRDFFLVCFSSIIRDVSMADPKIPPPVLLRPDKFQSSPIRMREVITMLQKKKNPSPVEDFTVKVAKNIERLQTINTIDKLRDGKIKCDIIWDDARNLRRARLVGSGMLEKSTSKALRKCSVGLVITSPPYICAQKYLRTTKLELFWLDMVHPDEVAELDRSFIGTERVYKHEYDSLKLTGYKIADQLLQKIYTRNRERAYLVYKFLKEMEEVIGEIHRVLKVGGRCVLVIGDNTVSGIKVETHSLIARMAVEGGLFSIEMILRDKIRSRGMITKRHDTGGLVIYDWVLVLRKER